MDGIMLQRTERDGTIRQVLERLRSEQERKLDAVLQPAVHVHPATIVEGGKHRAGLEFEAPGLQAIHGEVLPIGATAHDQIAYRAGIPKKYYDRMVDEAPELWRQSLRTWWERDKKPRLVRTFRANGEAGTVRAWLSDRFRVLDNLPFLEAALEGIEAETRGKFHVAQVSLTRGGFYVRVLTEKRAATKAGEEIQQGIALSNSEVGQGKVKIQPFAVVLACTNGMIGTKNYGHVHLGGELDPGLVSAETIRLRSRAVWSEVRDFLRGALSEEHLRGFIDRMEEKAEARLPQGPRQVIANVAGEYKIAPGPATRILDRYLRDAHHTGETQWGIIQAITYEAHEAETWDEQEELETIGGKILERRTGEVDRLISRTVSEKALKAAFRN